MWKRLLKLAVSVGLLSYLLHLVDAAEIVAILRGADATLLSIAFLVYLAGQGLSAVKWRALSAAVGFDRPMTKMASYYLIGMFFNAFGLGTVGGDMMRGLYLAGRGGRRTLALNTVVADRVSGLLVLLAIALVALLSFRTYELPAALYWTTLLLCAGLLAGWRVAPLVLPRLLAAGSWPRRLVEVDLEPYWNDYGLLARVSFMSLVFHLSQIALLALLATALHLSIPWSYFFIFGPLVNIFSALPVSWNGLGIREGGYVFFLGHIGIGRELAIAFGLSWFAMGILGGFLGGLAYLFFHETAGTSGE
jgi:hypothetical protein